MNKKDKTSVGSRVGFSKSTVTRERERSLRKTKNGWGLKAESLRQLNRRGDFKTS